MLRKVIVFLIVLIAAALAFLFVFINTFDINRFLPQLTAGISQSIGRQVTVEKARLRLSFKSGIVADLQGISLVEDEQFSKDPFVSIEHIHCGVDLLAFLTRRQIQISSIVIQSPQLTLIRNEKGVFNFQSLLHGVRSPSSHVDQPGGDTPKSTNEAPLKILVNSFEVRNAKIVFMDRMAKPAMTVGLESIDAKVTNFSLTAPFKVQLDASMFSSSRNIHLDGTGRFDIGLQQVRCDDVRFSLDLGGLDIDKMNKSMGGLNTLGLQSGLKGLLEVAIHQMVAGPKGLLVLKMEGKFINGNLPLKMLSKPVEGLSVIFDMNESRVRIPEFVLNLGVGSISGTANIREMMTAQDFDLEAKLQNILVEDTFDQSRSPARLKGSLAGVLKISGEGFVPQSLDKFKGQAQLVLTKGELTNINIIKAVLERIPVLSALGDVAAAQFSQDLQSELGGELTKIDKASVKARIQGSKIFLDEAIVSGEKFTLSAQGIAGFDQTVDMDSQLRMSKELSQSIIDSAGEMKSLLDEQGQMHFPVKITGRVPQLTYMPDIAYISKVVIINKGGSALEKVLDKNPEAKAILDIFSGGNGQEQNDGPNGPKAPAGEDPNDEESSGQQLLKDLLKNF